LFSGFGARGEVMRGRGVRVESVDISIVVRVPNTTDNGSHLENKLIRTTIWVDVDQLSKQYAEKAYRNKSKRVEEAKGGLWIVAEDLT
jgi:hypothetical protein